METVMETVVKMTLSFKNNVYGTLYAFLYNY